MMLFKSCELREIRWHFRAIALVWRAFEQGIPEASRGLSELWIKGTRANTVDKTVVI